MEDIVLTKQQIFNLLKIYDHFRNYDDFTVTLGQEGKVSVSFDSRKLDQKIDRTFVPTL
jgi:hypothetical protein